MGLSSNKLSISVTTETPSPLLPGEFIIGSVKLNLTKPLSVSELRLTFFGRGYSHIFRKYLFSFAAVDWYGQGFLFERIILLIDGPTTLPPGEHQFKFAIQVPEISERVRKNFKGLIQWSEQPPFAGRETVHALPPTMAMEGNNNFGYTEGEVEYVLKAEVKKGPEAKLLSMSLNEIYKVKVSTPQVSLPAIIPHHEIIQSIASRSGPVNLTIDLPQLLVQDNSFPVMIKADPDGVILDSFSISIHTVYMARGRSIISPEKCSKTTATYELGSWDGRTDVLPQHFVTAGGPYTVPGTIPGRFATFNVACLAHWIVIRFTLRDPNDNKKIKSGFPDIPVGVFSSKAKQPLSQQVVNQARDWYNGNVMNSEQYSEVKNGR